VIVLGAVLGGCSGGSEETGRIHVSAAQVAGVYKLGPERVELRADGTYVQKIDAHVRMICAIINKCARVFTSVNVNQSQEMSGKSEDVSPPSHNGY